MPHKAKIDLPGMLHHIIASGIELKRIFTNSVLINIFFTVFLISGIVSWAYLLYFSVNLNTRRHALF